MIGSSDEHGTNITHWNSMQQITIGLLWHSLSSGNLGVGALTESNIAILREIAERQSKTLKVVVLGTGRQDIPELAQELRAAGHIIENQPVRVFRASFREQVKACDLVIDIGEGDSFADIYGFKRFFYYWLSKNIVLSLGKPLILAPQTIGPFDGHLARILATQVMRKCSRIFSRDQLSSAYLKQLQITSNIDEAIDVAFKLPFTPQHNASIDQTHIGINVSGLLFNGGYTGKNQFGLTANYPELIRKTIDWFTKQPDVVVHLIPHVLVPEMPAEDDLAISRKLAQEFPTTIVAPTFGRPSEAKSYISSMDFFCGARMHACIGAFSSGVPVVPMAYSRKFNGLFSSLNYEDIVDLKKMDTQTAFGMLQAGFENRAALKIKVANGNLMAREKIMRYIESVAEMMSKHKASH